MQDEPILLGQTQDRLQDLTAAHRRLRIVLTNSPAGCLGCRLKIVFQGHLPAMPRRKRDLFALVHGNPQQPVFEMRFTLKTALVLVQFEQYFLLKLLLLLNY